MGSMGNELEAWPKYGGNKFYRFLAQEGRNKEEEMPNGILTVSVHKTGPAQAEEVRGRGRRGPSMGEGRRAEERRRQAALDRFYTLW